jgi:hypothetical protein
MNIEKILYDTTRELREAQEKMRIATVFIFCQKTSSAIFAELLYCENPQKFVENLAKEQFESFELDLAIDFDNQNMKNAFLKTREAVKNQEDKNGFLKALYEKDDFALVIEGMVKKTKKLKKI